jgi:hypothetical protein
MQSGDRLSYHPEYAEREIAHWKEVGTKTEALLHTLAVKVNSPDEGVQRALLGKNPQDPSSRETLAQYRMLVNRAALLAEDASSEVR